MKYLMGLLALVVVACSAAPPLPTPVPTQIPTVTPVPTPLFSLKVNKANDGPGFMQNLPAGQGQVLTVTNLTLTNVGTVAAVVFVDQFHLADAAGKLYATQNAPSLDQFPDSIVLKPSESASGQVYFVVDQPGLKSGVVHYGEYGKPGVSQPITIEN